MIVNKRLLIFSVLFLFVVFNLKAQISFPNQSQFKYLKGSQANNLSASWTLPTFDDSGWSTGNAPFRYGDGAGGTELTDMMNSYSTVYLRSTFTASNISNLFKIQLNADYDDGFVIWINGQKILSQNAPNAPVNNSLAPQNHESGVAEMFQINVANDLLNEGENTIAILVLNNTLESSDLFFDISLTAEKQFPVLESPTPLLFSHQGGFYETPFNLTISSSAPDLKVVYTIDGSNPQTSSTATVGSATVTLNINPESNVGRAATPGFLVRASVVKDGYDPSIPESRTFIFSKVVRNQNHPGGNWPVSRVNEQVIDLAMDTKVINDSRYTNEIDASLLDLPSISVVTDLKNLFDPNSGIYVNAERHGRSWEKECSVELLNPDKSEGFNVNAGLRIRGGWSRHPEFPKHSFRLFFRKEYGAGKLNFPLFGDEGVSEFDKIDLRTEQNYSWAHGDSRNSLVREVFSRDTQKDMGRPYTRSRYYHLYLNGMYWGIYQTQERSEADYAESYFGDAPEDYDVIKVTTENFSYITEATDGTDANWRKIYNLCNQGFTSNTNYYKLEGKDEKGNPVKGSEVLVDIDNLIDYMLVIFYTGNFDAPVSAFGNNKGCNNFYVIDNRNDKSKGFMFFAHDSEHSMLDLNENRVNIGTRTDEYKMEVNSFERFHPQWIHFKLSQNPEYRIRFADRANKHLKGEGALTPAKAKERLQKRINQITKAVVAESARWGDSKSSYPYTKHDHWLPEVNGLLNNYIPNRTNILTNQLKQESLFPNLEAPTVKKQTELILKHFYPFNANLIVSIVNPNSTGKIYFTTNGTDPRLPGGAVSSEAFSESSLEIKATTIFKARIYNQGAWSPLKEIHFLLENENFSNLKFTEIHYHPKNIILSNDTTLGKDLEFIEFKNIAETALNVSGVALDSGVRYIFPENTIIGANQFYVIASKPSKFYNTYGLIANGNFKGNLSNSGEELLLTKNSTELIRFTFSDKNPWPTEADGQGYSLVSVEKLPTGNPGQPAYWRKSYLNGGSPYADDKDPNGTDPSYSNNQRTKIYPIPTSNALTIVLDKKFEHEKLEVDVLNMEGVLIYKTSLFSNQSFNLPANTLQGIYILRIKTKSFIENAKVIYSK